MNLAVITVIIILEVTSVAVHQIISSMKTTKRVEVRDVHELWSTARVNLGQVRYCTWKALSTFSAICDRYILGEKTHPSANLNCSRLWFGEFLLIYS